MEYKIADIVEFRFRPNSIDVMGDDVTLVGVVSGLLIEERSCIVQMIDNNRGIHGSLVVPEFYIVRKVEEIG